MKATPCFGGQLRGFVQDLEADPIADERGHIFADDHLAAQPFRQHRDDALYHRRIGIGSWNDFGADDHLGRIEQVDAEEIAAKRIASSARHLRDRQARGTRRHDRFGTPAVVDQLEKLPLERQIFGQRLEHNRRLANRAGEIAVVGAHREPLRDRFRARIVLCVRESQGGFFAGPRQQRDAVTSPRQYASRARAHGAVGADNHDLVVVGQAALRSW